MFIDRTSATVPYMKFLKFIIALLLLPATVALTKTLYALTMQQADLSHPLFSPLTYGLVSGLLLLLILPNPIRTYVLGHELTHALWGLCMGARVGKINVTKKGGHVELSKTNFLITLAPYFFPFYTILIIALYAIGNLFTDLHPYHNLFLFLVGITWAFHLHFTLHMLANRHQPDITEQGRLFSYTIIYSFNLITLMIWMICVGSLTLRETRHQLTHDLHNSYHWTTQKIETGIQKLEQYQRWQRWKNIIP
tara:strand:- start:644 stop:1396 length:753 start_codon:yes stop_codon:yes gene_type:complete